LALAAADVSDGDSLSASLKEFQSASDSYDAEREGLQEGLLATDPATSIDYDKKLAIRMLKQRAKSRAHEKKLLLRESPGKDASHEHIKNLAALHNIYAQDKQDRLRSETIREVSRKRASKESSLGELQHDSKQDPAHKLHLHRLSVEIRHAERVLNKEYVRVAERGIKTKRNKFKAIRKYAKEYSKQKRNEVGMLKDEAEDSAGPMSVRLRELGKEADASKAKVLVNDRAILKEEVRRADLKEQIKSEGIHETERRHRLIEELFKVTVSRAEQLVRQTARIAKHHAQQDKKHAAALLALKRSSWSNLARSAPGVRKLSKAASKKVLGSLPTEKEAARSVDPHNRPCDGYDMLRKDPLCTVMKNTGLGSEKTPTSLLQMQAGDEETYAVLSAQKADEQVSAAMKRVQKQVAKTASQRNKIIDSQLNRAQRQSARFQNRIFSKVAEVERNTRGIVKRENWQRSDTQMHQTAVQMMEGAERIQDSADLESSHAERHAVRDFDEEHSRQKSEIRQKRQGIEFQRKLALQHFSADAMDQALASHASQAMQVAETMDSEYHQKEAQRQQSIFKMVENNEARAAQEQKEVMRSAHIADDEMRSEQKSQEKVLGNGYPVPF